MIAAVIPNHFIPVSFSANEFSEAKDDEPNAEIQMNKDEDQETATLASKLEAMDLFKDLESSFEICDAEGEMDEDNTGKTKSFYERCLLS